MIIQPIGKMRREAWHFQASKRIAYQEQAELRYFDKLSNRKAPLEKVFPLFGPIKEMAWAEGWNPEIVYSESDSIEEKMVFKTKSHGHGEPNYTWTVSKYSPEQSIIILKPVQDHKYRGALNEKSTR